MQVNLTSHLAANLARGLFFPANQHFVQVHPWTDFEGILISGLHLFLSQNKVHLVAQVFLVVPWKHLCVVNHCKLNAIWSFKTLDEDNLRYHGMEWNSPGIAT